MSKCSFSIPLYTVVAYTRIMQHVFLFTFGDLFITLKKELFYKHYTGPPALVNSDERTDFYSPPESCSGTSTNEHCWLPKRALPSNRAGVMLFVHLSPSSFPSQHEAPQAHDFPTQLNPLTHSQT